MPELKLFAIAAEDVLAISMVALVSFALGMIITILFDRYKPNLSH